MTVVECLYSEFLVTLKKAFRILQSNTFFFQVPMKAIGGDTKIGKKSNIRPAVAEKIATLAVPALNPLACTQRPRKAIKLRCASTGDSVEIRWKV